MLPPSALANGPWEHRREQANIPFMIKNATIAQLRLVPDTGRERDQHAGTAVRRFRLVRVGARARVTDAREPVGAAKAG